MMKRAEIKAALETLLFVWGEPLAAGDAGQVFDLSETETRELFLELKKEYDEGGRGIRIREIAGAFQYCTDSRNAEYVSRLCQPVKEQRLSQGALEVLAIIAYRQPVTRVEIESIRGIRCDRTIESLSRKQLIAEVGRGSGIGRPILYGTTRTFLEYLGLRNLSELPPLAETEDLLEPYAEVGEAENLKNHFDNPSQE
ncbi:MAG TPA: SMC-Scp complex subunit ScpB [Clostridiales bacterium]|jgi:segregation and condensation protein B|nr:SMC-Scp complex subunit ScpB [Clostridiales bacterium]